MSDSAAPLCNPPNPARGNGRQLLAYTEDRTIWLLPAADGRGVVRKVFERGTLAQAQAEADLGARLRGEGFVTYLGAEPDPESQRPSTLTEHVAASDLTRVVAAQGPLAPRSVAALGINLCRTLRRVHIVAVHRDVKPSNVLVPTDDHAMGQAILLDAEHACLLHAAAPRPGTFTGGTHGWSPPEAYRGAAPTASFDAFGLGATLWFAATGWPPFRHGETAEDREPRWSQLEGLPIALATTLRRCLKSDARARASVAEVEDTLDDFLRNAPATPDPLDTTLLALQRDDLDVAEAALASTDPANEPPRQQALHAILRRRRRLSARRSLPIESPQQAPLALDAVAQRGRTLLAFARRFPAHAGLRRAIAHLRQALAEALDHLPIAIAAHKRTAQFAIAHRELTFAHAAIAAVSPLGGPAPRLADGAAPSSLQRIPHRLLQLTEEDVTAAGQRHAALLTELDAAEAALDVGAAAQAIDHGAGIYGGASEVVANLKDRLHRLTFFVERLAQPNDVLGTLTNELAVSGDEVDLAAVAQCFDRCRRQGQPGRTPKSSLGLRTLLRTLRELAEELPTTAPTLRPATEALATALDRVSNQAWGLVEDSRQKLASVPIPVRPLQNQIARLDHLRLIDALIDGARGSRAELLDELERLRSEVDQARTTRDRIASGARASMERGHLTTALYDLARAVDRYDAPPDDLEEARKRKNAVEDAMRENHRLAARYAELEDDPTSAMAQRVDALTQRLAVLAFLGEQVTAERATNYAQDRLDVEVRILQEQTADAERLLDTLAAPASRLQLTAVTLRAVDSFARARGEDRDRLGRVQRMREHWDSLHARARTDVARDESLRRSVFWHRRRSLLVRGLVGTLALALAIALFFLLRERTKDALGLAASSVRDQLPTPMQQADFDPVQAVLALDRFAAGLEASGLQHEDAVGGRELLRATRDAADHASATARGVVDWLAWERDTERVRADFERACADFAPTDLLAGEALKRALKRFGQTAEMSAVLLAARATSNADERAVVQRYATARGLDVRL